MRQSGKSIRAAVARRGGVALALSLFAACASPSEPSEGVQAGAGCFGEHGYCPELSEVACRATGGCVWESSAAGPSTAADAGAVAERDGMDGSAADAGATEDGPGSRRDAAGEVGGADASAREAAVRDAASDANEGGATDASSEAAIDASEAASDAGSGDDAAVDSGADASTEDAGEGECALAEILLVVDRSGSMDDSRGTAGLSRMEVVTTAVRSVAQARQDDARLGLMMFPGIPDFHDLPECMGIDDPVNCQLLAESCGPLIGGLLGLECPPSPACEACGLAMGDAMVCEPGNLEVAPALGVGMDIGAVMDETRPSGASPTSATLVEARATLSSVRATAGDGAPQAVILISDGDPNCVESTGGGGGVDNAARLATIAAIEDLATDHVPTRVIGVGTAASNFADVLDDMAVAGGVQTEHVSVGDPNELAVALEEAIDAIRCE